jgi:predicted ATPase
MHLIRLTIPKWKNLNDLTVHFDQDTFTSVFVGRNGTGKSNVLEALIIIFRDLDLEETTQLFAYELEYSCRGAHIFIDSDPIRAIGETIRIRVDGEEVSRQKFSRKGGGAYLPSHLFIYYSGQSTRMVSHFEKHEGSFDQALRKGRDMPLRPLLYVRLVHSMFALLSFFWNDNAADRAFLKRYLRIKDLDSVLFVLKKPSWYSPSRNNQGDPRFWGALGIVRDLLGKLYDLALCPLRVKHRGAKGGTDDRLYLFLKDKEDLLAFGKSYKTRKDFFSALESLHVADLVQDVRARVRLENVDGSLTFRELSEGEQQLLMVLGLLRFTCEEEALILLDEPDTHLNPAWSLDYVNLLEEVVPKSYGTHVVMATHDPLVLAGLQAKQVHVMRRDQGGRITATHPEKDPIGMGVSALLTSDIYGLRSELDSKTLEKLDLRRRLTFKKNRTIKDEETLAELNEWIKRKDFTRSDPDPMFAAFEKAMTKALDKTQLGSTTLTDEERRQQEELAFKIMQKQLQEKEKPEEKI